MPRKRLSRTGLIGQRGIALIEDIVLKMQCVWYPSGTPLEAGIDGHIELVDAATGEMLNLIVQVQSKATDGAFQAETETGFEFRCDDRDIDYWLGGNAPVILIRSRPSTGDAYWKCVTTYFADPKTRAERRIVFDKKEDCFDVGARERMFELAADRRKGLYLSAPPKSEDLVSNLLRVASYPTSMWVAPSECETREDVETKLKGHLPGPEFIIREGSIVSFHDLNEPAWGEVSERGSAEEIATSEWAESDDPVRQREFVELLNLALRELTARDLEYHRKRGLFYFRPTKNKKTRYLGGRAVFRPYPSKRDPSRISYFRHSAFEAQFVRLGAQWYAAVTPTYHFTRDGVNTSPYVSSLLKTIKRFERNDAVRQQTEMWARRLRPPDDLLSDRYRFLEFAGELERFEVEFGINDEAWKSRDILSERERPGKPAQDLDLFDAA